MIIKIEDPIPVWTCGEGVGRKRFEEDGEDGGGPQGGEGGSGGDLKDELGEEEGGFRTEYLGRVCQQCQ